MLKRRYIVAMSMLLLFGGLLFVMAAPSQAFAATTGIEASRWGHGNNYVQGYRQGYNDAVYDCKQDRSRTFKTGEDAFNRGYRDGYNYARENDRACKAKGYPQGYRQGYNDAVYDCKKDRSRTFAAGETAYDRGYRDGYNYARLHDRACKD